MDELVEEHMVDLVRRLVHDVAYVSSFVEQREIFSQDRAIRSPRAVERSHFLV